MTKYRNEAKEILENTLGTTGSKNPGKPEAEGGNHPQEDRQSESPPEKPERAQLRTKRVNEQSNWTRRNNISKPQQQRKLDKIDNITPHREEQHTQEKRLNFSERGSSTEREERDEEYLQEKLMNQKRRTRKINEKREVARMARDLLHDEPKFTKEQNIERLIRKMERMSRYGNADFLPIHMEEELCKKLLIGNLNQETREKLEDYPHYEQAENVEEVKKLMRECFKSTMTESTALSKLSSLKQGQKQKVDSFYQEALKLVNKLREAKANTARKRNAYDTERKHVIEIECQAELSRTLRQGFIRNIKVRCVRENKELGNVQQLMALAREEEEIQEELDSYFSEEEEIYTTNIRETEEVTK